MITLMEAYNNGTLLQYIMDICYNTPASSANDYETNWNGHQPLTPMKPTCSKEEDASGSRISASELRFERKRRRRGVIISPRDNDATDNTKQVNY